jgi:hypothetical protein
MVRRTKFLLFASGFALALLAASASKVAAQAPCNRCSGNCGNSDCGCSAAGNNKSYCCMCDAGCCGCDLGYMKPIKRAQWYNWNRNYAHTEYGQPVALVVPPTANLQTNWGWGVASSRITRIDHQFQRNYPGYGQFGGPYRPTPIWPSDTSQFGAYYVRGPW